MRHSKIVIILERVFDRVSSCFKQWLARRILHKKNGKRSIGVSGLFGHDACVHESFVSGFDERLIEMLTQQIID